MAAIPIVDLFAGPGGLSEGFDSFQNGGNPFFRCVLSIEKEKYAHRTLLLRSFVRQFPKPPSTYYEYLRGEISLEELYKNYPNQLKSAKKVAIRRALGHSNRELIDGLIRQALGRHRSEWILIGGPPCQAYSLAGRVKIRDEKGLRFEKDRRHFLYKEYLHIVKTFQPAVFVMENVKGLLSSSTSRKGKKTGKNRKQEKKTGDTFSRILKDFEAQGYSIHSFVKIGNGSDLSPTDYVIEAEEFGVPQARHRVILLGLRKDIARGSATLKAARRIPIESAINDLPRIRSQLSPPSKDSPSRWEREVRKLRSVVTRSGYLRGIKQGQRQVLALPTGSKYIETRYPNPARSAWMKAHDAWFIDRQLRGVTLHQSRGHMPKDLRRYLFASYYARIHGGSPKIHDFRSWQLPNHENITTKGATPFEDRFRVQVKGKPCTTVVSHISKDGHYYIHYDSTQCRSLTVREAARIQTFPDNYYFEGTKTAQYQQVGNAVPPLLAKQIAQIVAEILGKARKR